MGVRLGDDETWAFLTQGHTGILTSLRRDGMPVSLPVWYAVVDRAVYVRTPGHTKKVARLRRDSRCTFLVESGLEWAKLKAVHLSGRAVEVEDDATTERVAAALDAKYDAYRVKRDAMPSATRDHYAHRPVIFRVEPTGRPLTWDNTKLRLRT